LSEGGKERLTDRQKSAIPHLVGVRSLEEGRKKAKIAKSTLYAWLRDPVFKDELTKTRNEVARDALDSLKVSMTKAVDRLVYLLDSKKEHIAKGAAEKVIEYGIRALELEEFEERLQAIEKAVFANRG
jgi:hypothetical protein